MGGGRHTKRGGGTMVLSKVLLNPRTTNERGRHSDTFYVLLLPSLGLPPPPPPPKSAGISAAPATPATALAEVRGDGASACITLLFLSSCRSAEPLRTTRLRLMSISYGGISSSIHTIRPKSILKETRDVKNLIPDCQSFSKLLMKGPYLLSKNGRRVTGFVCDFCPLCRAHGCRLEEYSAPLGSTSPRRNGRRRLRCSTATGFCRRVPR
jgi:hypothetical protein